MNLKIFDRHEEDTENTSSGNSVKNKKESGSVIVPLILSIFAAIALWLFVVAENNTCDGISIRINGNEQLMSYSYTISSIEPSTIDLVLKGKNDQIERILADKSLITATVNVFGDENGDGDFLFNDVTQIKPGEYTVNVEIVLPEGVSCSTKSVKVTVSPTFSRVMEKDSFKINLSNYSFGNGFSKAEEFVRESSLTVSGDESTVSKISYIGLNIDWLKEVTNDVEAVIVPVAYDSFGGVIDSKFLRFEPAQLNVVITVNKSRNFPLVLNRPEGDTGLYTLSQGTVRLVGPVSLIDKIGDEIVLNEDQNFEEEPEIRDFYVLDAGRFGNSVMVVGPNGTNKAISVQVTRTEGKIQEEIVVPVSSFIVMLPEGKTYTILEKELRLTVEYSVDGNERLTYEDLLVFLDLIDVESGEISFTPMVALKNPEKFRNLRFTGIPQLTLTISEKQPLDTDENTPDPA